MHWKRFRAFVIPFEDEGAFCSLTAAAAAAADMSRVATDESDSDYFLSVYRKLSSSVQCSKVNWHIGRSRVVYNNKK